jgi:hypothetical protein
LRVLDVHPHHLGKKWWLGSVLVVPPSAIGDEANLFDKIKKVLNDIFGDLGKRALCAQKTLDDPERVPVIRLTETTPSHNEGPVDGNERVDASSAIASPNVAPGEIGPDVDDLASEVYNDGAVDIVEKPRVRLELIGGDRFQF